MSKNKNKGAGLPAPTPENVKLSARNPIDPQSILWANLSGENKLRMYKLAQSAANERFRNLERKGLTNAPIYKSYKEKGYRIGSGNVGLSSKGYRGWSEETLQEQYELAYRILTAKTSTPKGYKEYMSNMLANVGVDFDELNPKAHRKELTSFWTLYQQLKKQNVWSNFGYKSEDESDKAEMLEIAKAIYNDRNYWVNKQSAEIVAKNVLSKVEQFREDIRGRGNFDRNLYNKMVENYNVNGLNTLTNTILYHIANKKYPQFYTDNIDNGEEDNNYLVPEEEWKLSNRRNK